ncbi:MAG TPA: MBL fold metallo-hydrolase [Methylococcus sp.]|nr:MBL fold metallo-hydrolase [Methylococcus sp.]
MQDVLLYTSAGHRFILLNESDPGEEEGIRSNQYLILHQGQGVLLDPGGFGVMPRALAVMLKYLPAEGIRAIILSHQDPDIVGGLATWLEIVDCPVYIPRIWLRFLPHYGVRRLQSFIGIPDPGMEIEVAEGFPLKLLPAHFLHSEGQINVFDPVSWILFSGDIGAGLLPAGVDAAFVDDFERHRPHIEGFHRRYMGGNRAARIWVKRVAALNPAMIAPQHGPVYRGQAVSGLLRYLETLRCGIDLMQEDGGFPEMGAP